jgi:hypothetical protein
VQAANQMNIVSDDSVHLAYRIGERLVNTLEKWRERFEE